MLRFRKNSNFTTEINNSWPLNAIMRRQSLYIIIYIVLAVLTVGCTGSSSEKPGNGHVRNPADTLTTTGGPSTKWMSSS